MFYATDPTDIENTTRPQIQERELEVLAHVHQVQNGSNGDESPANPPTVPQTVTPPAANVSSAP